MAPSAPDAENTAPRHGPAVLASLGLSAEQVHRALTGKPLPEHLKAMAATRTQPRPRFQKHDLTPKLRRTVKDMKRKGFTHAQIVQFTGLGINWVTKIMQGKV